MNMEVPVYPQIVGDTAPRTVETAPTAPTPQNVDVLSRLLQLRQGPTLTAEQRERLETMIEELTISQNEAWALAAEIEQGNRGFLEERHGEIRSKGRKLHALVERLAQELNKAKQGVVATIAARDSAFAAARAMKESEARGEHVPRWATDQELADWRKQVVEAEQAIKEANELVVFATRNEAEALQKFETAQKEYQELGAEEVRVRHLLDGKQYFDPELGLSA